MQLAVNVEYVNNRVSLQTATDINVRYVCKCKQAMNVATCAYVREHSAAEVSRTDTFSGVPGGVQTPIVGGLFDERMDAPGRFGHIVLAAPVAGLDALLVPPPCLRGDDVEEGGRVADITQALTDVLAANARLRRDHAPLSAVLDLEAAVARALLVPYCAQYLRASPSGPESAVLADRAAARVRLRQEQAPLLRRLTLAQEYASLAAARDPGRVLALCHGAALPFTGDTVLQRISPLTLRLAQRVRTVDVDAAAEPTLRADVGRRFSARQMESLQGPFDLITFEHGPVNLLEAPDLWWNVERLLAPGGRFVFPGALRDSAASLVRLAVPLGLCVLPTRSVPRGTIGIVAPATQHSA
jgi:hypothetical protein